MKCKHILDFTRQNTHMRVLKLFVQTIRLHGGALCRVSSVNTVCILCVSKSLC